MTAQDSYDYTNVAVTELEDTEYSRLVSVLPANLCIVAISENRIVRRWVSQGVADIFGYDVKELQDDPNLCINVVHPVDRDRINSALDSLLSGKSTTLEYRIFRRDGQMRYIQETSAPGRDSSGRVVRVISLVTDITAEKSVEEHKIQFRQLLDETPSAVAVRDQSGKLIYCNEACARMYGYSSAAEMIGTTFDDILPQEYKEDFEQQIRPKLLDGPWSGEVRLKRKDGSCIDVSASTNVLRKSDGTPWAMYGILSGITEHKRAEQALRDSEELLRVVQNSLMANVAVLDKEGTIIAVNEAWKRFASENGDPTLANTGVGVNYLDVCRRAEGPRSEGAYEALEGLQAILEGKQTEFELVYPCPSPSVDRWFTMRASSLRRERGGAVVSHYEITELVEAERELAKRNRQMEVLSLASRQVNTVLDIRIIMRNLVSFAMELTGAEGGMYGLIRDGRIAVSEYNLKSQIHTIDYSFEPGYGVPGYVWVTMKPYICNDAENDPHIIQDIQKTLEIHNLIDVPVISRSGEFLGLFELHNKTDDQPFDSDDISMLESLAAAAAVALDNARMLEERIHYEDDLLRLTSALDAASDGIRLSDPEGNVFYINVAMERMLGYNTEDFLQKGIGIAYADPRIAYEVIIPAIKSGKSWEGEIEMVRKNGSHIQAGIHASPVYNERGELIALMAIITDITDRKLAEKALRESEQSLRSLTENVDAMIFRMSPDYRSIAIVGKPERMYGYTAEELIVDPALWPGGVHRDDIDRLLSQLSEAAAAGVSRSIEFRIITKSGDHRWLRTHITPQYDESGNLSYYDGISLDITERIESQQRDAKYAARMSALADISQAFASSLNFDEIINAAVKIIGEALNCVCAAVSIEPDTKRLYHLTIAGEDEEIVSQITTAMEKTMVTANNVFGGMEKIRPRIDADIRSLSPVLAQFADMAGVGPGILAPVRSDDELLVIFGGLRKQGEPEFDNDDLWFLTEVASHASAALTKASIFRHQTRIAETLQRSLIPAAPELECMDVATFYSPASGEAEVGGDFFDIIDFGGCVVGIVVGDVSGKGMDAAIHTAEAKYMIRGYANQNPDPGYVITELNKTLCIYTGEFSFVTLFYGLLCVGDERMLYVNAGHESPIILCRNTHSIKELLPNGPIIGVIENQNYNASSVILKNSHMLFCYTDGLVDIQGNGERFGYDRLYSAVSEAPVDSSRSVLDHVVSASQTFARGERPDDQVILVIRPQPC